MILKAYNKRLGHTAKVMVLDLINKKVKLLQPNSSPEFYYTEKLENVELKEYSGIVLDGVAIHEGDSVKDIDTGEVFIVKKRPGGFYPFVAPIQKKLKKV